MGTLFKQNDTHGARFAVTKCTIFGSFEWWQPQEFPACETGLTEIPESELLDQGSFGGIL